MIYLSKQENKEAFNSYLFNRTQNQSLDYDKLIIKFNELFTSGQMTIDEKKKIQEVINFTVGPARAAYNSTKTAVIMCEMPNFLTLGMTRNMTIIDLSIKTAYNLQYGKGYKIVKDYINSL